MIYLSWSIIHLVTMLVCTTLIWLGVLWTTSSNIKWTKKQGFYGMFFLWGIVLGMAFDIGVRQQHLDRTSFNATPEDIVIDKTESTRSTVQDVKTKFESAVKETK